jgi:uncharacterized protein DUF3574
VHRPRRLASGFWLALLVGLGCAPRRETAVAAPAASCPAGDSTLVHEVVYFGRNSARGGTVSDTEWQTFLDEVVTPRFPRGFTVVEAVGQWRGQSGTVERERSEILTLLHGAGEAARGAVAELAAEYKRRFRQEAVLRERTPTCARFE